MISDYPQLVCRTLFATRYKISSFLDASSLERNTIPPGRLPHRRLLHSFQPMNDRRWLEYPLAELHTSIKSCFQSEIAHKPNMIHKRQLYRIGKLTRRRAR